MTLPSTALLPPCGACGERTVGYHGAGERLCYPCTRSALVALGIKVVAMGDEPPRPVIWEHVYSCSFCEHWRFKGVRGAAIYDLIDQCERRTKERGR